MPVISQFYGILVYMYMEIGGIMQGRIIENSSNLFKIKTEKSIYEANARGKFKKEEISPVVGDLVEIEILDEENKKSVIEQILPRTTYIKRPKMSNITQIILVVSSKNPKPDLLLLDKQLAFAEYLGINPIIVPSKPKNGDKYTNKARMSRYLSQTFSVFIFCICATFNILSFKSDFELNFVRIFALFSHSS